LRCVLIESKTESPEALIRLQYIQDCVSTERRISLSARSFSTRIYLKYYISVSVFVSPVTSLPPITGLSHATVSQSLVMSPGGVAADGSVTLTLAEAQGMLEGVTLNLNTQVCAPADVA